MGAAEPLVDAVRAGLREAADPERAPAMAAYMKSAMPFLGVRRPAVRRLVRAAAKADPPADLATLADTARELWDGAAYREERYAAQDLLGLRLARGRSELLPLHQHLAVTGAWWDHVDEVAVRIGEILDADLRAADTVRRWSEDPDRWLRRLAILSQLGRRERTDRALLAAVIEPNVPDREFFIRKAIGWALREVAYVDPDWVRAFVAGHDLAPLSRREALKHLQ
ncbi:MAG TPA: DNA alkylation repair protein [Marmoricola sp.]|nr:DNA alkylation repair protein [Marmoricola sp.]